MDAYVYLVVVLIDDADNFLITFPTWYAYQSAELADTEVHMNDIIARFHLLKFFHCERYFACPGTVRLKTILMKAVEYLMICKETYAQIIIDKSLMKCNIPHSIQWNGSLSGIFLPL